MTLKKGDRVCFKGNREFKPLDETYIAAISCHEMLAYYIEHPDGNKTKQSIRRNGGFPDGFESPHSSDFEEGKRYIFAIPEEVKLLNTETSAVQRMKQGK